MTLIKTLLRILLTLYALRAFAYVTLLLAVLMGEIPVLTMLTNYPLLGIHIRVLLPHTAPERFFVLSTVIAR